MPLGKSGTERPLVSTLSSLPIVRLLERIIHAVRSVGGPSVRRHQRSYGKGLSTLDYCIGQATCLQAQDQASQPYGKLEPGRRAPKRMP